MSKIVLEDENAKPIARNKRNNHKRKSSQNKAAEIMAHRRRKIWANMAKKEVGKVCLNKFVYSLSLLPGSDFLFSQIIKNVIYL